MKTKLLFILSFPLFLNAQEYKTFMSDGKYGIYKEKTIIIEAKYDSIYCISQKEPFLFTAKK
jgi:hypothetical protein